MLLRDTHALPWRANGSSALSPHAARAIDDAGNRCVVSSATAWELATKYRLGRLAEAERLLSAYAHTLASMELEQLAISSEHALLAGSLDGQHGDPFDRILAAQALIEGAVIVTKDPAFAQFGVVTLW